MGRTAKAVLLAGLRTYLPLSRTTLPQKNRHADGRRRASAFD